MLPTQSSGSPAPLAPADLPGIFIRAAQVIQDNGHYTGGYVAPGAITDASTDSYHLGDEMARPVDVVGAIRIACGLLPTDETSHDADAAIWFAGEHLPHRAPLSTGEPDQVEELAQWNDFEVKSGSEVVGRLLRWSGEASAEAKRQMAVAS